MWLQITENATQVDLVDLNDKRNLLFYELKSSEARCNLASIIIKA